MTYDAAFMVGTRYPASSTFMPCVFASATRNVKPKKPPTYRKKLDIVRKRKVSSLNGVINSLISKRLASVSLHLIAQPRT